MTHTLMLLSSPRGQASLSRRVASALADRLTSEPGATIKIHDLAAEALPNIGPAYVVGRMLPRAQRTPVQAQAAGRAEALIDELKAADVVVIAASMINFAPSSTLKAGIDHVVWPGQTMVNTHSGPKGLLTGDKVYLVVASGAVYSSGPMEGADFLVPYLKHILGCIGLFDIETIRAEGQSFGPEAAKKGLTAAMSQVAVAAQIVRASEQAQQPVRVGAARSAASVPREGRHSTRRL
jgi:FMN-dependent NADH-azoreductase